MAPGGDACGPLNPEEGTAGGTPPTPAGSSGWRQAGKGSGGGTSTVAAQARASHVASSGGSDGFRAWRRGVQGQSRRSDRDARARRPASGGPATTLSLLFLGRPGETLGTPRPPGAVTLGRDAGGRRAGQVSRTCWASRLGRERKAPRSSLDPSRAGVIREPHHTGRAGRHLTRGPAICPLPREAGSCPAGPS